MLGRIFMVVEEEEDVLLALVATTDAVFVKLWVEMIMIAIIDATITITAGLVDIIIFQLVR